MEESLHLLTDKPNFRGIHSIKGAFRVQEKSIDEPNDQTSDLDTLSSRQRSPRHGNIQYTSSPPTNGTYALKSHERGHHSDAPKNEALRRSLAARPQRWSDRQQLMDNFQSNFTQAASNRLVPTTTDGQYDLPVVISPSVPNFRRQAHETGEEYDEMPHELPAERIQNPATRETSPSTASEVSPPVQDNVTDYDWNARRSSPRQEAPHSPESYEINASRTQSSSIKSYTPPRNDERFSPVQLSGSFDPPKAKQEPAPFETGQWWDTFRTPADNNRAQAILSRNKEEKIDKRSSISKILLSKSKTTKYNQREIYRALFAVVNGDEIAGPGVVEVLLKQFQDEDGDVNFVPQGKKGIGSILKKRHEERSGLLEIATRAGNVEVVQLLSKNSDSEGLNAALAIAFRKRNAVRKLDTSREDEMIRTLVFRGADGSHSIGAAVAVGDENLLSMLLRGNPPVSALSEALPAAVAFRDADMRQRLTRMLLDQGAGLNHGGGEAIYQATKLFDMSVLDMLLERRPLPESLNRAFASALAQPDSSRRFEACQKLVHAGAVGDEVSKGLALAMTSENQNLSFLKMILQGASVDFEDGYALSLAVTNNYQAHLKLLLEKRPNECTFDNALEAALRLRNPRDQLKYCNTLVAAGPTRKSCSKALLIAVTSQRDELCRIFLEKGASVDFQEGASITAAARSENVGILSLLIGKEFSRPSNDSLVPAFEAVLSLSSPFQKKKRLLLPILDAGLQGPRLDAALISASSKGQEGLPMVNLLLDYGASVNESGGEALDIATRSGNMELLGKLLQYQPSAEVLSKIFESAMKLNPKSRHIAIDLIMKANMTIDVQVAAALDSLVQERNPDMRTIRVLLEFGTSVHYENHRPLISAGKLFNETLLLLLLEHSTDISAPSVAFEALMKVESFWGKRDTFTILTRLLEHDAAGIAVDEALIKTLNEPSPEARQFEITLLQHGASIDHNDGEALQLATEHGNAGLIRRMLVTRHDSHTVSMAFPYVYVHKHPGPTALAIIRAFIELAVEDLYPEFMHPAIPEPPVFLSVKHYPNNVDILAATLTAGFPVDQTMSDKEIGSITALYWSIVQGNRIGDEVVEFLIRQGASLEDHTESLLHLAIEDGRHEIVQCLIDAGVDVDLLENGVSPLALATQKNDITTMKALLAGSATANDGSLHDAGRMANVDAIRLLLEHGHDESLPCSRFAGRPPLFELCLNAPEYLKTTQKTATQKETMLKRAIEALISANALSQNQLAQSDGRRSLLLHALDSASPYMMTKALLECGQFRHIDEDFNLFDDGEYTYSPTKYVEKGKCRGDKTQNQSLVQLLKTFHATDRFWKNSGPQPPDYVNAPPHIIQAEDRRKQAEERKRQEEEEERRRIQKEQRELAELRRKNAMEEEAAQAKREREELALRQRRAHEAQDHAIYVAKENDKLKLQEQRDRHALKQAASMSKLRNDENRIEHDRKMKLLGEQSRLAEEQSRLAQSKEALSFAYNQGVEDAGGRKALGPSPFKTNRNRQIGWGRIEELDE